MLDKTVTLVTLCNILRDFEKLQTLALYKIRQLCIVKMISKALISNKNLVQSDTKSF